jgi:phytanoyl-CoA hydroxylase
MIATEPFPAPPPGVFGLPKRDDELDRAVLHYRAHGWARLGPVIGEADLARLRARADAMMLGDVTYPGLFFQRDADSGRYEDLEYGKGWLGPSLAYRKIEKLELDPLFRSVIELPSYERVVHRVIAGEVTIYRAMLMTKSAEGGSDTPWHQDGGDFWGLDRDPVLQLWTALDDAPEDGGCVEVLDGTHTGGLVTTMDGVVPTDAVRAKGADARATKLPARAGEALLIHNHVWHRSGRSVSGHPRRALTVCYMSAETRCRRKKRQPRTFFPVFRG